MDSLLYYLNPALKIPGKGADIGFLSLRHAKNARSFHATFSQYQPTPLVPLPHLAHHLGLGQIFVKDESHRFGLNAFKVLGASYAIGRYVAEKLGFDISELNAELLTQSSVREGCNMRRSRATHGQTLL